MRQFGRVISLKVGNSKESVVINNLRVTFSVSKTKSFDPNTAEISIYNLNDSNRNLITSRKYNIADLSVCYRDDTPRLIFTGYIIKVVNKIEGLDIVTVLTCSDGHLALTGKTINKTLTAGATDKSIMNEVAGAMEVPIGNMDLPNDRGLPRGKVMMCDARDVAHKVAKNNSADWSIQDGKIQVVPKDKAIANTEGFIINRNTGMIGSPSKTNDGLEVTTLCNPYYKIGGVIRVESKITEYNGDYKITKIDHTGDNYGGDWKSKITVQGGKFVPFKGIR